MDMGFYIGGVAARVQQDKLDIVSNNMVNGNTNGFKTKNVTFSDLLYNNLVGSADEETEIKRGSGARLDKTNTIFDEGSITMTGRDYDFAILEDGFFGLEHPETGERVYTRAGSFYLATRPNGEMYLSTVDGYYVLGEDDEPMMIDQYNEEIFPAIYTFERQDRLLSHQGSYFTSMDDEIPTIDPTRQPIQGAVENSNMNTANEMTKVIEAQRAYQYAIRVIQTADEVQNMINSLR